jgi:hypothetical protein
VDIATYGTKFGSVLRVWGKFLRSRHTVDGAMHRDKEHGCGEHQNEQASNARYPAVRAIISTLVSLVGHGDIVAAEPKPPDRFIENGGKWTVAR